ncbi:hypothetical protein K474DRAFT_1659012 [Panus rudis PR-1116 ss-1]|nr:hypothetical protein K474DRAFT_1659012 [Panus rudis PR-1116 ss-1]
MNCILSTIPFFFGGLYVPILVLAAAWSLITQPYAISSSTLSTTLQYVRKHPRYLLGTEDTRHNSLPSVSRVGSG